ncbi:Asp23/Gls24 family envelope stress response protein [Arthrobacter sp. ZBG10]|uniref:Asp23/Gls24 family envelope stress response protein n=1 Tax=Arthrobacter sp. ZBG10 TaxID=1676590 RepID=UPI0009E45C1C|nr:Asp23/Gls24 family envelope stress response protein [Arthrobacter sp. ZBG10]
MAMNSDRPRLGCGRDLDEFWATIDEPPTSHELSCPDCQSARNALYHLASVTESMRERDRTEPSLQPGNRVKEAVMMVARAEIRRGRKTALKDTPLGRIDISEQALTALIRFAASTLTGVRARRCSIAPMQPGTPVQPGTTGVPVPEGTQLTVELQVALASTVRIPDTLAQVRERVGAVVEAQTALLVGSINIIVEDLYDL